MVRGRGGVVLWKSGGAVGKGRGSPCGVAEGEGGEGVEGRRGVRGERGHRVVGMVDVHGQGKCV
jgi:hypothetical protein